ncbi:MAG: hypothetical protein SVM80_01290 [Halobacteriota archaeon]|nr:hypothetical protein [Halobacteriota archaeon]
MTNISRLIIFASLIIFLTTPNMYELPSKTIIEIREDGSAAWTIEERFILNTDVEVQAWKNYTKDFERDRIKHIEGYKRRVNGLISEGSTGLNREMHADNFKIDLYENETFLGRYGVVRYSFTWYGFADLLDGEISVGDAFSGIVLQDDEVLIISIPENYELVDVQPSPHDRKEEDLIWYGYVGFNNLEPSIVITEENGDLWISVIIGTIVALGSIFSYVFFRYKRPKEDAVEEEIIISDEEKIKRLIMKMGGEMYQSDIVIETGFSKSKVSNLVTKIQRDGEAEKIKIGRRNLIRLKNKRV